MRSTGKFMAHCRRATQAWRKPFFYNSMHTAKRLHSNTLDYGRDAGVPLVRRWRTVTCCALLATAACLAALTWPKADFYVTRYFVLSSARSDTTKHLESISADYPSANSSLLGPPTRVNKLIHTASGGRVGKSEVTYDYVLTLYVDEEEYLVLLRNFSQHYLVATSSTVTVPTSDLNFGAVSKRLRWYTGAWEGDSSTVFVYSNEKIVVQEYMVHPPVLDLVDRSRFRFDYRLNGELGSVEAEIDSLGQIRFFVRSGPLSSTIPLAGVPTLQPGGAR